MNLRLKLIYVSVITAGTDDLQLAPIDNHNTIAQVVIERNEMATI